MSFSLTLCWLIPMAAVAEPGATTKTPQRIICVAPNSAEVICALGACDRIVGVSKFCVYPPELMDKPRIGGLSDPDIERIIALRPDLVVTRGRIPPLEESCEQLKLPIYRDETDTLSGIETCLRDLGERLGRASRAEALIREFRARLAGIRSRTAGKPKPRVFLAVARDPDRLANIITCGKETFLDQMVEAAGGLNVFGQLDMVYPQVSPEAVIAQQPEVILEFMPEATSTPELEQTIRDQWKQLGSMPAIAAGRVHIVDDDHCLIPSPRYTEIVEKVSRILHPDE